MSDESQFRDRLDRAVAASGLSLNRIAAEAKELGAPVTRTTLSSWLSGAGRPRRQSSLTVVLALERILGTEPGELAGALDLGSGRSVTALAEATTHAQIPRAIEEIREEWALPQDDGLERLLILVRLEYSDFTAALTNLWVVRAQQDGARRFLFAVPVVTGTQTPAPGELQVVHGGSLGRRTIGPGGAIVHEVILDRALAAGDVAMVELLSAGPGPQQHAPDHLQFISMRPLGAVSLQVRFAAGHAPRDVLATTEDTDATGRQSRREFSVDVVRGVAHVTMGPVNVGGIRLEWDPSARESRGADRATE